jgi:hypothetical protein
MITPMRPVFSVLLCLVLVHVGVNAEGLSFTNNNKDVLCSAGQYCSEVQIRQSERGGRTEGVVDIRQFTLRVEITLWPNSTGAVDPVKVAQATSVDVDVVVETDDLLKYEFNRRNAPIMVQGKGENAVLYAEVNFNPLFNIVTVHAIDVSEKDRKGNVIFRHKFR